MGNSGQFLQERESGLPPQGLKRHRMWHLGTGTVLRALLGPVGLFQPGGSQDASPHPSQILGVPSLHRDIWDCPPQILGAPSPTPEQSEALTGNFGDPWAG